eukprot:3848061-Pyramimonas_sp.AAC.1
MRSSQVEGRANPDWTSRLPWGLPPCCARPPHPPPSVSSTSVPRPMFLVVLAVAPVCDARGPDAAWQCCASRSGALPLERS